MHSSLRAISIEAGRPRRPALAAPARGIGLAAAALLLCACASTVPEIIRAPLPGSPQLTQVRQEPRAYLDVRVRWGGTIASIENEAERTAMQIVGRPLAGSGRPRIEEESQGRFLAVVPGFLDPAVFEQGREVTVVGTLRGSAKKNIGEYPYEFPVVVARDVYLWQPEPSYYTPPYPVFWPYPWGHPAYGPHPYYYW